MKEGKMPKKGHISLSDLNWGFGSSLTSGGLVLFSEDENRFREEVRKFVVDNILPLGDELDKKADYEIIRNSLKLLGKAGLLSVAAPVELGGRGKSFIHRVILGEEVSAASAGIDAHRIDSTEAYGYPVLRFGTKEQKEKYLKPVLQGEKIGGLGMTEPGAGCDLVGGMTTTAVRDGDSFVINVEKRWTGNGTKANYICLYTLTDPSAPHKDGMTAFIFPTETEGFERIKDFKLCGLAGSAFSHLRFHNCRVSEDNILGRLNRGYDILMENLDEERIISAAGLLGPARSAFEIAAKYTAERVQFKRPIREFEDVSFKIAEMHVNLEIGRLLILTASRIIESGRPAPKEAAACKYFLDEKAEEICSMAMGVMGGIGCSNEYPVERYWRDVKPLGIGAATAGILKFNMQRLIYKELGY
jgi:alkylation response protein AidB-like acyl-CoA dehydrogenase